jgi:hypothetical protein
MASRQLEQHVRPFHAVKFYKDAASLTEIVCGFVGEGLKRSDPAVLIASAAHMSQFRDTLTERGIDCDVAVGRGRLVLLDADEILGTFMQGGIPVADAFRSTLGSILSTLAQQHPGRIIRAYGEMVDLLWQRGETAAALRLESLWNDLARSQPFQLLCGYAMGHFYKGSAAEDICAAHTHVLSEGGRTVPLS